MDYGKKHKASGTHKSMGSKDYVKVGLESGVSETQKVGDTKPAEVGNTGRVKKQSHGSIAKK